MYIQISGHWLCFRKDSEQAKEESLFLQQCSEICCCYGLNWVPGSTDVHVKCFHITNMLAIDLIPSSEKETHTVHAYPCFPLLCMLL